MPGYLSHCWSFLILVQLDEENYELVRQQRIDQGNFIVDDDGDYNGYYDDGRELYEDDDDDMLDGMESGAAKRSKQSSSPKCLRMYLTHVCVVRRQRGPGGAKRRKPGITFC